MLKFSLASMLAVVTAIAILLAAFAPTPKRVPQLFMEYDFDSTTLANAANYFVARGEKSAVAELTEIAARDRNGGIDLTKRVGWLCRILWENEKTPIRPPMLGGLLSIDYDSTKLNDWPLFPVAKSGDTYFVLSQGYILSGQPEWMPNYIDHCQQNGSFRRWNIPVPTRQEAIKDLRTFRDSARWRAEFSAGGSKWTWGFIMEQAESIGRNAG